MNTLLIATVRTNEELRPLVEEIRMTVASDLKLVISSSRESVAINVNRGLNNAEGDFILKVDDDITGFQRGWDLKLIEPMQRDPMIGAVAARLLNKDGSVQLTCSRDVNMHPEWLVTDRPIVPFCCVAFRNDGTRMDERYVGSGYDDGDYCNQLRVKIPNVKFAIHNEVRVIHKHEQKNAQLNRNALVFREKWAGVAFADGKGVVE